MSERALIDQLDHAIDAMLSGLKKAEPADAPLSRLMEIAGKLRDMPDEGFKLRLIGALQEEFQVAIHAVTPFICLEDAEQLIEFMKRTFGAEVTSRHAHHGPDGFVAGVRIGDSDLLIMGGKSLRGQECLAALHVNVKDCDAIYQRTLDAGAVTIGSPADRRVLDPFGNYWFIATRPGFRNITPRLLPSSAPTLVDFLKRALGAKVEEAFVRMGEALVEVSEAQEERSRPCACYMYTDDVDAVYHRALAAGATSILPPADQPFSDRLAIFQDPGGNRWLVSKRIAGS